MKERYHLLIIILHWLMAIGFITMFALGLIMTSDGLDKALVFKLYQWHKSGGVLLLLAFVLRLAIRLLSKTPQLPDDIPALEKKASKLGHLALYMLMLLVPLSGWIMVSSSIYGLPTIVFGWFEWPHIPGIQANAEVSEIAEEIHEWLAYFFIAVIVVHAAAVVKHYKIEKINLLKRMWFGKD